jgi:hypothetical protein
MAFGNPFAGWSDAALVRPYVARLHPERTPADAVPPSTADRCDRRPSVPLVVFWRVVTHSVPFAAGVFPWAGAGVLELHLCGHHATSLHDALTDQGWVVVLDRRQRLADEEATH